MRIRSLLLTGSMAFVMGVTPVCTAAASRSPGIPRGFTVVEKGEGVTLLRQRRDYVQVLSVEGGARIRLLQGQWTPQGEYAAFPRKTVQAWWSEFSSASSRAFSVVNGQFFDTTDAYVAPLAFSVKADGQVHEGYGDAKEYPGKKRLLLLGARGNRIIPYDDDPMTLVNRTEQDIVVGLSPEAAKSAGRPVPRTFLGITRRGETVIFSSSMASQTYAVRMLRIFGVDPEQIIMLDGGQSSHLVHNRKVFVPLSGRGDPRVAREALPQMLGVEEGTQEVGQR